MPWSRARPSATILDRLRARPPRPSRTPCTGVSPARQPQSPAPTPVPDPTPSLCVLASIPPDHVDFFLENVPRGRGRQRYIFSQNLALPLADGLISYIFFRCRPGRKMGEDLCPPGRDLVGIQTFAPQIEASRRLREPCRLNNNFQFGLNRPCPAAWLCEVSTHRTTALHPFGRSSP